MSSQLPQSIAFHVGVHKTATSHLQRCLAKASDRLAARGVRYFGPQYFRQPGHAIRGHFGFRDDQAAPADRPRGADRLAQMAQGCERLVLSEENYIGALNAPGTEGIALRYREAGPRVATLADALGQPIDVFVGVRCPTAYLNGAYGQLLLSGRTIPFMDYIRHNPVSGVDWVGLVQQLRAAAGVRQVIVWRYEDYASVFGTLTTMLVGAAAGPLVSKVKRVINPGLSSDAVDTLLQANSPDMDWRYAQRDAFPMSDAHLPHDGFTQAQHAVSEQSYQAQLNTIGSLDGVTLLRP